MKRILLLSVIPLVMLVSCERNVNVNMLPDVGRGYEAEINDARFCSHCNGDRFFFNFEVLDSTLSITTPFTCENDVCPEDRVEIFFAKDALLQNPYYCAEMDPEGRVLDYKAEYYRKFDDTWDFSTLDIRTMKTDWGYRVGGSISLEELRSLGMDLENGFQMGVFLADFDKDGSVNWQSLVPMGEGEPDFHRPEMFFECRMSPGQARRGIVVYPDDITSIGLKAWEDRLAAGGINLVGIHSATFNCPLDSLELFVRSDIGQDFLKMCERMNVDVEYEIHALQDLLPRDLFDTHPEYFRQDEHGDRCRQYNMCFSSEEAIEAIRPQIKHIMEWMHPTTHRYFMWTDDVKGAFCHCDNCCNLTPSEQALMYENRLLKMIREYDPQATLAHLAYHQTLEAPSAVRASEGVFLEYAPISRDYSVPLTEEQNKALKDNLLAFPAYSQHILEYWLDESMFSKWKRDALVPLPFDAWQCHRDIMNYTANGALYITCFATWLNASYERQYGSAVDIFGQYGSSFQDQ